MAVVGASVGIGATSVNADTITVQRGDTVSALALKYNETIQDIVNQNHLSNPNLIYVGQQLQVGNSNEQEKNQVSVQKVVQAPVQKAVQAPIQKTVQTSTPNANSTTADPKTVASQSMTQGSQNNTYAQADNTQNNNYQSNVDGSNAAAKAWIAQHESSNNYDARNGQYIGKYQLSAAYLNGDYSPANQERCADQYVSQRYGSWDNAKQHWLQYGWY